jgi:predicted nucleic acid-binding protein
MSRVFWDTNPYIYLLEGAEPFHTQIRSLRQRMLERRDELLTSTMTLGEIQVGPRRSGNNLKASQFRDVILQTSTVLPFDTKAADIYAKLREDPAIKPPDAIQLSCAAAAGVELFITNDKALHRLTVPGIHFIASLTNAPL